MQEFKKYTTKGEERPILQYVHFDGTHFIATNSHILVKVNKDYISNIPTEIYSNCLYDPIEMEIVENTLYKYPDTSKVFPYDCGLNVKINNTLNEIQSHIKLGNTLLKGKSLEKLFQFTAQDDYLEIKAINSIKGKDKEIKNQSIMRHNEFSYSNGNEIIFSLKSEYVTNALATIKRLSKLSHEDVQFKIKSRVQPVVFEQNGVFSILILPVVTYWH